MDPEAVFLLPSLTVGAVLIFKVLFILFSILYFLFSLIVVRQVNLMTSTIVTEGGPILRAISIVHAGLALGAIVLFIGLF